MDRVMWQNDNIPHALQCMNNGIENGCNLESSLPVFLEEREIRRTVIYHGRKNKIAMSTEQTTSVELSTDQFTPGVLKIFGGTIVPGVEYKSVLASYRSTAPELVKQALERYGVNPSLHTDYVLCDVVGKTNNEVIDENANTTNKRLPKWQMMCSRVLADSDRPLLLQNFWRPAEGYSRRYELHNKSEISNSTKDDDTMGLNANARKISMAKLRPGAIPFFTHWNQKIQQFSGQLDITSDSSSNSYHPPWDTENSDKERLISSLDLDISDLRTNVVSPTPREIILKNVAPMSRPFLLTIRGFNVNKDQLVNILENKSTELVNANNENSVISPSSIQLFDPDIMLDHCELHLKRSSYPRQSENYCLEIQCSMSSHVKVNGYSVSEKTVMYNGDILYVGEHYIFLFKDFTSGHEIPHELPWLCPYDAHENTLEILPSNPSKRRQNIVHVPPLMLGPPVEDNVSITTMEFVGGMDSQREKFRFAFSPHLEEELVKAIAALVRQNHNDFPLSPAYLYAMCVQYACVRFDRHQIRNLLLRILMTVRESVADISNALKTNKFNSCLMRNKHTSANCEDFLKSLVRWISNCVQLILYLRQNNFRMNNSHGQKSSADKDMKTAFYELAAGLEEVVIFSFQQIIYTITKALYVMLPSVLDGNPFTDESSKGTKGGSVKRIIGILDSILSLASSLQLHNDVTKQVFSYLFFFCSTTVFNRLFLSDAGRLYYNWSSGVRIRANLGQIEDWASRNFMEEEFGQLFEKLLTAAEFLSTSKTLLLKYDWKTMKKHFRPLNEAQLYRLLSGYYPDSSSIPKVWRPTPEDKIMALKEGNILLDLSSHPTFLFPTSGCDLDLLHPPDTASFWMCFRHLHGLYGTAEEESDIGGSPTNTPRFNIKFPKAELQKSFFCKAASQKKLGHRKVQFVETDSSSSSTPRNDPSRQNEPSRHSVSSLTYDSDVSSVSTERAHKSKAAPPKPKRSPRSTSVPPKLEIAKSPTGDKPLGLLSSNDFHAEECTKQNQNKHSDELSPRSLSKTFQQETNVISKRGNENPKTAVTRSEHKTRTCEKICEVDEESAVETNETPNGCDEDKQHKDLLLSVNKQIIEAHKETMNRRASPSSNSNTAVNAYANEIQHTHSPLMFSNTNNPVFSVQVSKGDKGLGLGLIDGLYTPLRLAGIYIRKILPDSPAAQGENLNVGDRLLCVNGKSIVGADYQSAMKLIKASDDNMTLMVAKGNASIASKIAATNC